MIVVNLWERHSGGATNSEDKFERARKRRRSPPEAALLLLKVPVVILSVDGLADDVRRTGPREEVVVFVSIR